MQKAELKCGIQLPLVFKFLLWIILEMYSDLITQSNINKVKRVHKYCTSVKVAKVELLMPFACIYVRRQKEFNLVI